MSTRFRAVAVWVAGGALSVVTATAIVAVFGWLVYGSIHAVPALAAGRTVISDPSAVWAGDLHVGERKPVSFSLINLDSRPLAIIWNGSQLHLRSGRPNSAGNPASFNSLGPRVGQSPIEPG